MIIYSVIVQIERSSEEEWIKWLKEKHIPEVLATGYFIKSELSKMLDVKPGEYSAYRSNYYLNSLSDYEAYKANSAAPLQKDHLERFPDKFIASRELYEVIGEFT